MTAIPRLCLLVMLLVAAVITAPGPGVAAPSKRAAAVQGSDRAAGLRTKSAPATKRKKGSLSYRGAAPPEIRLSDLQVRYASPSRTKPPPPVKSRSLYSAETTLERPLVVIDPGHGGDDLGAVGIQGHLEKDVVLRIAMYLEELLRDRLRARTLLTRTTDLNVPLADRTKVANDSRSDLFISIHTNASEYRNASGVETYYLDNTNDKSSLKLAERENQAGNGAGAAGDIGFIVSDLIQNAKLDDSISLAHHVQDGLVATLGRYYEGVKNLGVKKAPFFVLVGAHMPCVLVEVSFIDHPVEGARLIEERYQRLIAEAMYRGVRSFFESQSS